MSDFKFDLLVSGGNIALENRTADIGIKDGVITEVSDYIPKSLAENVINAAGCTVTPPFVDAHQHLDKTFTIRDLGNCELLEAAKHAREYAGSVPEEKVIDDIMARAGKAVRWAVSHGTGTIRTHVLCDSPWGVKAIEAADLVKKTYRDVINIENTCPHTPELIPEWKKCAKAGMIDYVGGYPTNKDDMRAWTDTIFDLAQEFDLPIDLHVNESDKQNLDCLLYVIQKTVETGWQGRVTCSHITALNCFPKKESDEIIAKIKDAGIRIITLPSCNMYLMGRHDEPPQRRGPTKIKDILDAGVPIAFASDNIRDPFRPFGNGNMLEEALITAQVMQYGLDYQLNEVFKMGTYTAAKIADLEKYGLTIGCNADMAILEAPTAAEAILSQCGTRFVLKNGKVVAANSTYIR